MAYPNSAHDYDRMRKLVISIILDYEIKESDFPLDMDALCRRMSIDIVPYSAYSGEKLKIMLKRSKDGFFAPRIPGKNATIFFNDRYGEHLTPARIDHTKGHEMKHIVDGDKDDSEERLCDYFSKYLRCPIPLAEYMGIRSRSGLISKFGVSDEQAGYILEAMRRRRNRVGSSYYDYEELLIRSLLDYDPKIPKQSIINSHGECDGMFDELLFEGLEI